MPVNKNQIDRLQIIEERLTRADGVTIEGLRKTLLDKELSTTKKTIETDLKTLDERLQFKYENAEDPMVDSLAEMHFIIKDKGCRYRYRDSSKTIFLKELSPDEKRLMGEVLNTLGQFNGLDNFSWMDGMRNKFGVGRRDKVIDFSHNEKYLKGSNLLARLFQLIGEKSVIRVDYKPFHKEQVRYTVSPYLLKEYNNRWYLICHNNEVPVSEGFNYFTLALDRIREVEVLSDAAYIQHDNTLSLRFSQIMGVTFYEGSEAEIITFGVDPAVHPYVETKPLHPTQKAVKGMDLDILRMNQPEAMKNWKFYRMGPLKQNDELITALTSYIGHLVVTSPVSLRDEIRTRVSRLNQIYEAFK